MPVKGRIVQIIEDHDGMTFGCILQFVDTVTGLPEPKGVRLTGLKTPAEMTTATDAIVADRNDPSSQRSKIASMNTPGSAWDKTKFTGDLAAVKSAVAAATVPKP